MIARAHLNFPKLPARATHTPPNPGSAQKQGKAVLFLVDKPCIPLSMGRKTNAPQCGRGLPQSKRVWPSRDRHRRTRPAGGNMDCGDTSPPWLRSGRGGRVRHARLFGHVGPRWRAGKAASCRRSLRHYHASPAARTRRHLVRARQAHPCPGLHLSPTYLVSLRERTSRTKTIRFMTGSPPRSCRRSSADFMRQKTWPRAQVFLRRRYGEE
jgi:hypothetical protein